jgi:hypothetical protein
MAFANSRTEFFPPWRRAIPLFLSVAGLWLVLLVAESVRPCFFLHDDNATCFIGAYVHDFRVLTETGRFAEVNYYQHGGEPFLEQGQTAVLYPPVYVGVALAKWITGDQRWTLEWIASIHLTIGLLGFYFWLRQGGVAPGLAALGGLAWAFNPFVLIVSASWIFITFIAAWLPWLFWALDYLLMRPSIRASFFLGIIAGLFFLQGYVQMFAYAVLFLAIYALLQFSTRPETRKPTALYHLGVSVIIFTILALPLLLPMLHAADNSAMRPVALSMYDALFYSCVPTDFFFVQLCRFHIWFIFGASTAILYCPALLFLPVMAFRLFRGDAEMRRRLFLLVCLALLALIFSTRGHAVLTVLPVFNKFRWPFKVFLFADFFLIASFVWTVASWTKSRLSSITAVVCLSVIVLANLTVSLGCHDNSLFSATVLPASASPVLPGMDSGLGRVATFADDIHDPTCYRYLTHAYATYYGFPSLGGYNPLVGGEQLSWALYLDFPNCCSDTLTRDFQEAFEARSVRYWIVDPHSTQMMNIKSLPGLRQMEATADRLVFEDTLAAPLVYAKAAPTVPCALTYSGNSMLISVGGVTSPVEVSVPPADGWWYRVDHGPWLKPASFKDYRLEIDFKTPAQLLEVSYFDPRFHAGLGWSAFTLVFLVLLLNAKRFSSRRKMLR